MNRLFFFMTASMLACDEAEPDSLGGQFGSENGGGCEAVAQTALTWDETASNGVLAQSVLERASGTHDNTLTWADGSTSALTVTVTVTGDPLDVDYEPEPRDDGAEINLYCPDHLEVSASVVFASDDGAFDEVWDVTLVTDDTGETWFSVSPDDFDGTFSLDDWTTESFDRTWAHVGGVFADSGLSGSVSGTGETTHGDAVSATSIFAAEF